ncbi:MAG: hypothetical protein NC914_03720, partial [Candidatus Omnitrophica bacterium]|nr:hypothetical protein [Candidatus Omnitrophota bacterium]
MKNLGRSLIFSIILTAALIFISNIFAAEMNKEMFISDLYGSVSVKKAGTQAFMPAKKDMQLAVNDQIKTGKNSYCEIAFDKALDTVVSVKENSHLIINKASIDKVTGKEETLLDLGSGSVIT